MARILAALVLWLVFARAAGANDTTGSHRVAVLAAASDAVVARRLRDELEALGFETVTAPLPETTPTPGALQELARGLDAAAVLAVLDEDGVLTIWVADRVTGKVLLRTIPMPSDANGDQARVIALRAVELLRASFRELETNSEPPGSEVPASPTARRLLAPSARRVSFDIGPAIAGAPGGIGPSVHVFTGARFFVHPHVSVGARALIPTVAPKISSDEGFARVSTAIVDAGVTASVRRPGVVLMPEVGLAVGLAILRMDGVAESPARGQTEHVLTASLRVQAGLAVAVHRNVRVRADASLGVLLPRPTVVFVDREVGHWGQPYGIGSLALEFVF